MELWADSAQSQTADFLRDIPASDPDKVYTLLRDVGLDDPPLQLRPSLMGVITNVPQPPRHTQRSYMFMVVLKDPSCWDDDSPRKDFVVFGFVPSPADLPAAGDDHGLRPGNVLRLRSVKVERRAGKLDGRVFRGSQLDVFSGAEEDPPVPLGAAGRPVTEAERRRLQWLRRWWLVERPHQERIAAATDARLSDVSGPGLCHLKVRLLALDESDGRLIARVTDGTRCPLPVGGAAAPPGSSDPAAGYSRVPVHVADRSCAEALRRGPADAVRFLYLVRVRVDCAPTTDGDAASAATFAMERADDPLVLPLDVSSDDVMDIRLRMEPATTGPGRGRAAPSRTGTAPGWAGTAPAPPSMVSAAAQTDMSFGEPPRGEAALGAAPGPPATVSAAAQTEMPLCELYRLWRGETACPAATAPPPADPAAEVPPASPDPAAEVPPASPVPPAAAAASTETASYAQDGCDAGQPAGPEEPPADDGFSTAPQSPAGPPPAVPLEAAAAQPAGRPFRTRCAVRWSAPSYHGPRSVWSLLRAACLRPGCRVLYRGSALPRPSLGADLGLVLECARCGGQLAVSAELPLTLHPLEGGAAPLEALASAERLLGVPVDISALLAVHRSVEDLIERAGRGLAGDLVLLPLPEAPRRYLVVEATLTDLEADTDCYTDGMAD